MFKCFDKGFGQYDYFLDLLWNFLTFKQVPFCNSIWLDLDVISNKKDQLDDFIYDEMAPDIEFHLETAIIIDEEEDEDEPCDEIPDIESNKIKWWKNARFFCKTTKHFQNQF